MATPIEGAVNRSMVSTPTSGTGNIECPVSSTQIELSGSSSRTPLPHNVGAVSEHSLRGIVNTTHSTCMRTGNVRAIEGMATGGNVLPGHVADLCSGSTLFSRA